MINTLDSPPLSKEPQHTKPTGARKALTLRFLRAGKNLQLRLEGFKHQCIGACAASVFAAMSANTADLDVTNPEQVPRSLGQPRPCEAATCKAKSRKSRIQSVQPGS